ncbi:MAG: murein biosynthesis integral membrane protein MurJ [Candidatus Spechtbacterales bacterium]
MISFFNRATNSVAAAAFILAAATLLSSLFGLVRVRVLAGLLGAGQEYDIFLAAFRVPDFIFHIVLGGAISVGFIPVFVEYFTKDKNEAWDIARSFFVLTALATMVLAGVAFVLMPLLVDAIVPGFTDEQKGEVAMLSRIMLISPILLGMSAIFSGILHSLRKFVLYAIAPILYNLGIIFGAVVFYPVWGISGIAWGVALGALLHISIQAVASFNAGFRFALPRKIFHTAVLRIIKLAVPRALGLVAYHINLLAITAIASTLAAGVLAIFSLASYLQYLPISIIGTSFATALFPALASAAAKHENATYLAHLSRALRNVMFLVLPASALIYILRIYIVRIVYGTGAFDWEDTRLTAATLGLFSFGIFFYAMTPLFAKAFYARQNTRTPVLATTAGFITNIGLAALFAYVVFPQGILVGGLARMLRVEDLPDVSVLALPLAFSLSGVVALVLIASAFFKERRNRPIGPEVGNAFARIGLASIITGLVAWVMLQVFQGFGTLDTFTAVRIGLQAGWALFISVGVYFLIALIFRFPELSVLRDLINTRFRKARIPKEHAPIHPEDQGSVSS